jgi:hypothetical protein
VACLAFKPVSYSKMYDSERTVQEIREHNASWNVLCKK